jgi:hypothetical protein
MTHFAPASVKTKKDLRVRLGEGRPLYFEDPSIFNPTDRHTDDPGPWKITVTNHPRRSWFAGVAKAADGTYKVT